MKINDLTISYLMWFKLIKGLRKRGMNRKESGAFLLGKPDSKIISKIMYYDDLDPHSLDNGFIEFDGCGYVLLWDYCIERNLTVLADVHTHPGNMIKQSGTDIANPMISLPGHIALIIPKFARKWFLSKKEIGIYRYLGNYKWETIKP